MKSNWVYLDDDSLTPLRTVLVLNLIKDAIRRSKSFDGKCNGYMKRHLSNMAESYTIIKGIVPHNNPNDKRKG